MTTTEKVVIIFVGGIVALGIIAYLWATSGKDAPSGKEKKSWDKKTKWLWAIMPAIAALVVYFKYPQYMWIGIIVSILGLGMVILPKVFEWVLGSTLILGVAIPIGIFCIIKAKQWAMPEAEPKVMEKIGPADVLYHMVIKDQMGNLKFENRFFYLGTKGETFFEGKYPRFSSNMNGPSFQFSQHFLTEKKGKWVGNDGEGWFQVWTGEYHPNQIEPIHAWVWDDKQDPEKEKPMIMTLTPTNVRKKDWFRQ